jgi:hypothetical protein
MVPPFDIFKMEKDQLHWLESAQDFEAGKAPIELLANTSPGDYVIFSQTTKNRFLIKADQTGINAMKKQPPASERC